MKIHVNDIRLCRVGGCHVVFDLTVNGTVSRSESAEISEITELINRLDNRTIALVLMYSHCKKNGATTLAQMKSVLINQEFEW